MVGIRTQNIIRRVISMNRQDFLKLARVIREIDDSYTRNNMVKEIGKVCYKQSDSDYKGGKIFDWAIWNVQCSHDSELDELGGDYNAEAYTL